MDQKRFSPKIINDPVYGFVTIQHPLIYQLLEHPSFQRLRHIKQLGLSYLVYPGANHTRFHHALGAMHLMQESIRTLRMKGVEIAPEEEVAVLAAILLHDIGHGPFSHALEHVLIEGVSHEEISLSVMQSINVEMHGALQLAISIFTNKYEKPFLHQLVSSQLDMDRLDYLTRDSFFTGVAEGVVSYDRIINMLTVVDGHLMVEEKGVNSIEKFLISRRLMYWQVYLHKTVLAAEQLLIKVLERAKFLFNSGTEIFLTPALKEIFSRTLNFSEKGLSNELTVLYLQLDDAEMMTHFKYWQDSTDLTLSSLSKGLFNRQLPKTMIQNDAFNAREIEDLKVACAESFGISLEEASYFVYSDKISNYAYRLDKGQIKIKMKNGEVKDVLELLTHLDKSVFTELSTKYYICYPKQLAWPIK
jgi:HD superfamily phosphohydrolase